MVIDNIVIKGGNRDIHTRVSFVLLQYRIKLREDQKMY